MSERMPPMVTIAVERDGSFFTRSWSATPEVLAAVEDLLGQPFYEQGFTAAEFEPMLAEMARHLEAAPTEMPPVIWEDRIP